MTKMRIERDEAAGGVVARAEGGSLMVVLIAARRDRGIRWALPKGHFKKRETVEEAATREAREETGLEVEIVAPLTTIDYWFVEKKVRYHKYVHYFVMRAVGGSVEDHDEEVDEARWFAVDDALRTMAYENERAMLESHREMIERLVGLDPAT